MTENEGKKKKRQAKNFYLGEPYHTVFLSSYNPSRAGGIITLSIGVAEFQSGATLKEILGKVYLAKQKGRDQVD